MHRTPQAIYRMKIKVIIIIIIIIIIKLQEKIQAPWFIVYIKLKRTVFLVKRNWPQGKRYKNHARFLAEFVGCTNGVWIIVIIITVLPQIGECRHTGLV